MPGDLPDQLQAKAGIIDEVGRLAGITAADCYEQGGNGAMRNTLDHLCRRGACS